MKLIQLSLLQESFIRLNLSYSNNLKETVFRLCTETVREHLLEMMEIIKYFPLIPEIIRVDMNFSNTDFLGK